MRMNVDCGRKKRRRNSPSLLLSEGGKHFFNKARNGMPVIGHFPYLSNGQRSVSNRSLGSGSTSNASCHC
jgi:hypothetical protein